jgi:hypothetical protein
MDVSTGTAIIAVAGLAGLIAITKKVIDVVRSLPTIGKDPVARNLVITQVLVWIAAILVVFLYGASRDLGPTIAVPLAGDATLNLRTADFAAKLIIGLALGSTASFAVDVTKAVDNTQTASVPPLLSSTTTSPVDAPPQDPALGDAAPAA